VSITRERAIAFDVENVARGYAELLLRVAT
jgi:hypothetical protein